MAESVVRMWRERGRKGPGLHTLGPCVKMVGKKTSSMGTSNLGIAAQYAVGARERRIWY